MSKLFKKKIIDVLLHKNRIINIKEKNIQVSLSFSFILNRPSKNILL